MQRQRGQRRSCCGGQPKDAPNALLFCLIKDVAKLGVILPRIIDAPTNTGYLTIAEREVLAIAPCSPGDGKID